MGQVSKSTRQTLIFFGACGQKPKMAYKYFLVYKLDGKVLAMLNWLGVDINMSGETLYPKEQELLEWLREMCPADGEWGVEGEYVRDDTPVGYTDMDQMPLVQEKAVSLGLTTCERIQQMTFIMNSSMKRLEKGEWVEVVREKVTPTYPRLEAVLPTADSKVRFTVVRSSPKKRKAETAAEDEPEGKKSSTSSSSSSSASDSSTSSNASGSVTGKIKVWDSTITPENVKRWKKYHRGRKVYIRIRAPLSKMGGDESFPVEVYSVVGSNKIAEIKTGNAVHKVDGGFRVVDTSFVEKTTNAKGAICVTGGYKTAAGIVYSRFKQTQRKAMRQTGLPPVGSFFRLE